MSDQTLRLLSPIPAKPAGRLPLGRYLVESGAISGEQLVQALQMQMRLSAPIGEILVAEGWVDGGAVMDALSLQHNLPIADLMQDPPVATTVTMKSVDFWLEHRVIPWKRLGNAVLVATSRPDQFGRVRDAMVPDCPDLLPVLAPEPDIMSAISHRFAGTLALAAQTRVAPEYSCRSWRAHRPFLLGAILMLLLSVSVIAPVFVWGVLSIVALVSISLFFLLKLIGFVAYLIDRTYLDPPPPIPDLHTTKLPKVSVLVPLFRETEIAETLVRRLEKIRYPKVLLDVILVLEEHDQLTREALRATNLPSWMRLIEVPSHNGLTTKPRAMNYALDFCKGDIVGVWDAEDAPAPDQIEQVVARFAQAPDDVVCLQGVLDYYNPRTNWLARCFTIEYSSWFRVVLPGIARFRLVVPLGGTTLFFRRRALEELGGWDAHNVTEDADLGVRLCRAGYRTEMIGTATFEEANCRAWPWIRQRSRWLKGFMVTYLVHMRSPRRLLRDLGAWRFFGFQAFFIGTLGQFLLAPVLWSFWLVALGFDHPVSAILPDKAILAGVITVAAIEVLGLCVGLVAVSRPGRRHLMVFVPTMMLYFPLGVIAAYKALGELVLKPFYWDKTQHGQAAEESTSV